MEHCGYTDPNNTLLIRHCSASFLCKSCSMCSYYAPGHVIIHRPDVRCPTGAVQWGTQTQTALAVVLPYVESLNPRLPQLPMAVPRDLAGKISSFHGYPFIWFFSQLLHYVMRPSTDLQQHIESKKKELGFKSTIVGYVPCLMALGCKVSA